MQNLSNIEGCRALHRLLGESAILLINLRASGPMWQEVPRLHGAAPFEGESKRRLEPSEVKE